MTDNHQFPIRVYIEDTDAGGIVYYANYLRYTERARTEWMRTFGYGKNFIFEHGLMFVVRSVHATFHQPATLDDTIVVETSQRRLAKSYIDLAQNIIRSDNIPLVETSARIALVRADTRRPSRIPADLYNTLKNIGCS